MTTHHSERERWERIEAVLDKVLELPAEEQAAALDAACVGESELRREVEALLAADASPSGFMEVAAGEYAGDLVSPDSLEDQGTGMGAGQSIGPYRLLQKIGQGGMGEVWEAEQTAPVRRRVALKVIKRGMDTRDVIARFEAERQALALMEHPSIAKVYDAGATPRGRPYFVMEHVKGVPFTEHCDRQRLTNRERLELFLRVCDGVQHAHQKAVIHRDLKPSNVLVSMQDGKAVPKIIDFGVAKATAQRLTEKTMYTALGVPVGTPEYMSPEQAEMTGQGIDTRADVYSLGVMLYELLVGARPFESKELRQAGFAEIIRKIREDEPPRPSTRLSTLGDSSTESAKRRQTELPALRRELAGDLDWITMKSLEKDRSRRYGSPLELAADLARYLRDEPVLARPPSAAYRAGKFARRHRLGVTAAVLVLAALLLGMAGTVYGLTQARREAARARIEATKSEQVANFMAEMLEAVGPAVARGRDTTMLREILDETAGRVGTDLQDQPEVEATIRMVLGTTYRDLGEYGNAEPQLRAALETRRSVLGDEHELTLQAMNGLGMVEVDQGSFSDAETRYLATLETQRRTLGEEHLDTTSTMSLLAILYSEQGRYVEAEPLHVAALDVRRRMLGEGGPETLDAADNLATLYDNLGRLDEAEHLYLDTLQRRRRVLGDNHPDTAASASHLASLYRRQDRSDEAEALLLETLETQRGVLGPKHPLTLKTSLGLALLYRFESRHDEAEALLNDIIEAQRETLGEEHPATLRTLSDLAALLVDLDRYDEAEGVCGIALEGQKRILGDAHPATLDTRNIQAEMYRKQGRYDEAEEILAGVLQTQHRVLPEQHPRALLTLQTMADLHISQGKYADAEREFLQVAEARRRILGDDHQFTLSAISGLANAYWYQGRYTDAEPLYRELLDIKQHLHGSDHPSALSSMTNLALLYVTQGRLVEAEPLYVEALAGQRRQLGRENSSTLNTATNLAALYRVQRRYDEAEPLLLEILEIQRRWVGDDNPYTIGTRFQLAMVYRFQGRHDEAGSVILGVVQASERVFGQDHPRTLWARQEQAELYLTQGRLDEAEDLFLDLIDTGRRVLDDEVTFVARNLWWLATVYRARGERSRAEAHYQESLAAWKDASGENSPQLAYKKACYEALFGERNDALQQLRRAIALGYSNLGALEINRELDALRGHPEFQAILAELDSGDQTRD